MDSVNKALAAAFAVVGIFFMLAAMHCRHLSNENNNLQTLANQFERQRDNLLNEDRFSTVEFAKLKLALSTAQMDAKELEAERDSYEKQCKAMQSMLKLSRHALRVWRREHGEPDIEVGEPNLFVAPAKE